MNEIILSELIEAVKKTAGADYEVRSYQVRKNNGVQLQAINCKKEGDPAVACVYVDQIIQEIAEKEMTVDEAAEKVFEMVLANKIPEYCTDTSRLTDKDFILNHVEYQIVNMERNQEQFDRIPHKDILDLSALYRVFVDVDENGTASYIINNNMVEQIGISIEELDEAATKNTEKVGFEVKSMAEIIAELTGMPERVICEEQEVIQMYVLTNKRKVNGANVILYNRCFRNLADKVGDDLFILPSSIHECLAIPVAQMEASELAAMVRKVNNEIADEEVLGYQVYKYNRVTGELNIA